jgi:hypothetical protein
MVDGRRAEHALDRRVPCLRVEQGQPAAKGRAAPTAVTGHHVAKAGGTNGEAGREVRRGRIRSSGSTRTARRLGMDDGVGFVIGTDAHLEGASMSWAAVPRP